MTSNKKSESPSTLKNSLNVLPKKAQFNLTARQNHDDYPILLAAKELFALLVKDTNLTRPALLLKLVKSFSLTGNFTFLEKQQVTAAAEHEGISIEEFNRRSTMLYANKILSKKTASDGAIDFVYKPTSKADLKVNRIITEMMIHNDNALLWQDKREITNRSVNDWGKHADTNVEYKSINQLVLKRYFMLHRDKINQHHQKHDIKPDHNRRAVAANNKKLRQAISKN